MSMFAAKNRNKKFRARKTSEDDEKNDNNDDKPQNEDIQMKDIDNKEEQAPIKPAPSAASDLPKKAPQKDTKKSLLTFGDEEEEGETFQIKKTNKPKKAEKKKLTLADLTEENEREQINPNLNMTYNASAADEYTPEKLAALRKNAKSAPSVKKDDDIQVVLKNTTPLARREEPIEMTLKRLDESADDENKGTMSMIPTDSQIASIKAKKERMRRYGGTGEDFISLNDKNDGKESALVREDSDDEDDEAFEDNRGSRIRFGDPTKQQKKKQTLYDELEGSHEEDDDFAQWELDQLKKSGVKKSGKNLPAGIRGAMYDPEIKLPEYKPPLKLEVMPTYEDLAQRLQESLASMKVSNSARKNQLIKVQEHIDDTEHNIKKCESDMKSFSGQYTFFQEMKSYVLDLTDCLEEKVREIETLEKQFNDAYVAIVNKARKNKQSRKQKEYEKISAALNLQTAVKQETSANEISYQKGNFKQEVMALKREYEQKARAVLEDVYEEFSSLYQVKNKFQQWKWDYPEAYNQANIALFLSQVFSPYVRIETLTWTPFIDKPFFDQMRWWQTLFDYGLKSESDQLDPKDEDNNLIPKLVERNLLNRGSFFFSAIWNPFAAKQSTSGLEYIKELVVYTTPEKLKDILVQVHITMQAAIDSINIVLPRESLPDEIKLLCQKQFDSALKLMKNIASWTEFMPVQTMEKLVVDQLLNMKMIPYLRVIKPQEAITLSEEIASALPQEWLKTKFMPTLGVFSDLLSNKLISAVGSDQESITRIVKLVNRLNDKNTAQKLNAQFKITL